MSRTDDLVLFAFSELLLSMSYRHQHADDSPGFSAALMTWSQARD